MVKINLQDFKPVQVRAGVVVTSGGSLRKEYPLHTKDVELEGSSAVATFVWISSNYHWLNFAVGRPADYPRPAGKQFVAGLHSQGLLKDLRSKVVSAEQRIRWPVDEEDDPMNEMTVPSAETLAYYQQRKKNHKRGLHFIKQVCQIPMKEWPPEMTPDSPNIDRMVSVYLDGTKKIWLHLDDLPWLIRSVYIEQQLKGVAVVPSGDEGPDAHDSMEDPVTPEKCRQPPKCEGNLHDKWSMAPF